MPSARDAARPQLDASSPEASVLAHDSGQPVDAGHGSGTNTGGGSGASTGLTSGTGGSGTGDTNGGMDASATSGGSTGTSDNGTNGSTNGDSSSTSGATSGSTTNGTTGATNGGTSGSTTGDSASTTTGGTTGATTGGTTGATTGGTTGDTTGATTGGTTGSTTGGTTGATTGGDGFGYDARPANPTCIAPERPQLASVVKLEDSFPRLRFRAPLGMTQAPGNDLYFYVLEQGGAVKRFVADSATSSAELVLTLPVRQRESLDDERGLLGMAFDPGFETNGYAYFAYTAIATPNVTRIERYTSLDGGATFDGSTALTVLSFEHAANNHNGGNLAFGPDGYLYVGLGDNAQGSATAQNLTSPHGKFLRIDVHGASEVPADNPYANSSNRIQRLVYAYGVRNPWRWSFDRATGELWAGDVGADCYEEIDLIERGKNYGWQQKEGFHCQSSTPWVCSTNTVCTVPGLTDPIYEYDGISVIGGYVYRGSKIPALQGTYVYADFGGGTLHGLRPNGKGYDHVELVSSSYRPTSFAEDHAGELYIIARGDADQLDGSVIRVLPSTGGARDTLPPTLKATGCTDASDVTKMKDGVLPYDLRVPFWSDGATKERWLAIPDGQKITIAADGDLVLPPGAVTIKTFRIGGKRIETRFYVRYSDGTYGGYTYLWKPDQSDALLAASSSTLSLSGQDWYVPSRSDCERCHSDASEHHLGLETLQLDRPFTYPNGTTANQLDTLDHIGLFANALSHPARPLARSSDTTESLTARARAYLHANCGYCHRPSGGGYGAADLRYWVVDPHLCNQLPTGSDLGIAGARLVVPGDPEKSLTAVRMGRRDSSGMPPLATHEVDQAGLALIKEWISSLSFCP